VKPHPIRTIYDLVEYHGLDIEFLDLPASNAGYLDPHGEPRYIALNRNLPHCEQVFTAAHEFCHYISDHKSPRRKFRNPVLNYKGNSKRAKLFVRSVRQFTNRVLPVELEADMFAMSWLVQSRSITDLKAFIERHPEKFWLCMYVEIEAMIKMPFRLIKAIFC
jgi:hypothetical protein